MLLDPGICSLPAAAFSAGMQLRDTPPESPGDAADGAALRKHRFLF